MRKTGRRLTFEHVLEAGHLAVGVLGGELLPEVVEGVVVVPQLQALPRGLGEEGLPQGQLAVRHQGERPRRPHLVELVEDGVELGGGHDEALVELGVVEAALLAEHAVVVFRVGRVEVVVGGVAARAGGLARFDKVLVAGNDLEKK